MSNLNNYTFSDGFPKTPLDAIDFSYFLSDAEKQEWREWLQTATPEQQEELVDILHSMWQDNQKTAVPESFANNMAIAPNVAIAPNPPVNLNQPVENIPKNDFQNPLGNSNQVVNNSQNIAFNNNSAINPNPSFVPAFNPPANLPQEVPTLGTLEPITPEPQPLPKITENTNFSFNAAVTNNNNANANDTFSPPAATTSTESGLENNFANNVVSNNQKFDQPAFTTDISETNTKEIAQQQAEKKTETNQNIDFKAQVIQPEPNKKENPYQEEKPKTPEKREKVSMQALVNGKQGYAPNPLLEKPFEPIKDQENVFQVEKKPAINNANSNLSNKNTGNNHTKSDFSQNISSNKKPTTPIKEIDYSQISQRKAKRELAEVYRELDENIQHQKRYTDMMKRIAVVMESYDQVVEYFEQIMEKVLSLNDVVMDIKAKQTSLSKKVDDTTLADEIHKLRNDLNDLYNKFIEEKRFTNERFTQVSSSLDGLGVDAFGLNGGAKEHIKQLERKIENLEKKMKITSSNDKNDLGNSSQKTELEKKDKAKSYKPLFNKEPEK
jgi:hypothetical protein